MKEIESQGNAAHRFWIITEEAAKENKNVSMILYALGVYIKTENRPTWSAENSQAAKKDYCRKRIDML